MHDPRVLEAVRRTWEGQPELSLATLFAMLANRGVGWGTSDEVLLRELAALERTHPGELPLVDARVTARYLIQTAEPDARVMVDPWRVIVRRPGVTAQPGVWSYATVRSAAVGGPLVVTSAEGIDHRLGVISRITLLDATPVARVDSLTGLRRRDLGDGVYLVRLAADTTVVISHGLDVFRARRRELHHDTPAWESLCDCTPGRPLVVQPPGGGAPVAYPDVEEILVLEGGPA